MASSPKVLLGLIERLSGEPGRYVKEVAGLRACPRQVFALEVCRVHAWADYPASQKREAPQPS
jgi:hypothetical protein